MPITIRRISMPSMRRFGDFIDIGFSAPKLSSTSTGLTKLVDFYVRRNCNHTAEWVANELLKRSQRNIRQMRVIDVGFLLASGYKVNLDPEGGTLWRVGYRAPYAWYVDRGTRNYRYPPPFEKIYEWVKRNIHIAVREEAVAEKVKHRRNTHENDIVAPAVSYNYVYRKNKQIKYGYPTTVGYRYSKVKHTLKEGAKPKTFIKPIKGNFEVDEEGRRYDYRKYRNEKEIRAVTARIQMHIFKHGTVPKPFWTKAKEDVMGEVQDEWNSNFRTNVWPMLSSVLKRNLRNAARIFGGHLRRA